MPERLTAQQAFEQMMRDQVAPALRQLGFRGSFRSFRYARGHRFAVLAARKSRHSNRHEVDFQLLLTRRPRHRMEPAFLHAGPAVRFRLDRADR